jgi:hypothetical protein
MKPISLPPSVPRRDFVPFGYIDNPWHSGVANRSGVIRSVPPLGFGFWRRRMPWGYADATKGPRHYLSFLHLSVRIGESVFHEAEDFEQHDTRLVSRYHTKTMTSFDFNRDGLTLSAKYFAPEESALLCVVEIQNETDESKRIELTATNIFGHREENDRWWGGDGTLGVYREEADAFVGKIWAGGDVFTIKADCPTAARLATHNRERWNEWVRESNKENVDHSADTFPGAVHNALRFDVEVPPEGVSLSIVLSGDTNERYATDKARRVLNDAEKLAASALLEDEAFYKNAPTLEGDWSDAWKEGWLHDVETLRATVRPPKGIFKSRWDGMQIFNPRVALGETALDMMSMSYADVELAKEVLLGTFRDAPLPNVPCTREDGSMNMIGMSGEECGTAPTWGMPFHVIRSIYLRDGDKEWLDRIYPLLAEFLAWYLENRTDEEGWFYSDNSWESGQDGSKRFLIKEGEEGAQAKYVRTVDVEAAMANAFRNMAEFAEELGRVEDVEKWGRLSKDRLERVASMYVDGWFRDFDGRTDEPIILKDYFDAMMLMPVSLGMATDEQVEGVKPMFRYFRDNPKHWLEWPSFMFPFTEAAWNAGLREFAAELLIETGDRVYGRSTTPELQPVSKRHPKLPDPYHYRIPGCSGEFWPLELDENLLNGCEHYGWGATMPHLAIRNVIGFRERDDATEAFILAPALPERLRRVGAAYAITNLRHRDLAFDLEYRVVSEKEITIVVRPKNGEFSIRLADDGGAAIETKREEGAVVAVVANLGVYHASYERV